jgi:CubicO group peptidase (beta-lactamase class C family)
MENTGFDNFRSTETGFYDIQGGEYKRAFPVNNSNKWAGGGMISTPSDLVRLGNELLSGAIIEPGTFEILTTPVSLSGGEINDEHYALGWRVDEFVIKNKKVKVIHHGGTATGSTALWIILPEYNITSAIMMNRSVEGFPLFDILIPVTSYFIEAEEQ